MLRSLLKSAIWTPAKAVRGRGNGVLIVNFICLEAKDWEVDREKDEERGEPGVGIEMLKK